MCESNFLSKRFTYSSEWQRSGGRDRERQREVVNKRSTETFYLLIHSSTSPNSSCYGVNWAIPKLGTRSFFWDTSTGAGPKGLAHLSLLSQAIICELVQNWCSWDMNWDEHGMPALQVEDKHVQPPCVRAAGLGIFPSSTRLQSLGGSRDDLC